MLQDLINGGFELIGGIFCWMNVYRLLRDKIVKGVYWPVSAFFTLWGIWNLYYYPFLNQWASFAGGLILVIGNGIWVTLAITYSHKS